MADKIFVDTNIWLYAFMDDNRERTRISREIISNPNVVLNTQILNEICINLLRKAKYTEENIQILIVNINNHYEVSPITADTILQASFIREKVDMEYWDSLIVASAIQNNCKILYSDILPHNYIIEKKLKIVNPFK
ncbi:MAG: PIN domain nuclease [Persephonella sp.]|nr:MAG: PIN domain nuclease [Persephonella sp.]